MSEASVIGLGAMGQALVPLSVTHFSCKPKLSSNVKRAKAKCVLIELDGAGDAPS
jgi:hypothetical protein